MPIFRIKCESCLSNYEHTTAYPPCRCGACGSGQIIVREKANWYNLPKDIRHAFKLLSDIFSLDSEETLRDIITQAYEAGVIEGKKSKTS